jgi:HSP20 family protein
MPATIQEIQIMAPQELQVQEKRELQTQEKRELQKKEETTVPARIYMPTADIFETTDALNVLLEMPGVDKGNVDIHVEDGVLTVEGRLNFSKYENMRPIYTEYNIGHYRRSFSLSSKIDQDKIRAEMKDGVLAVTLPKVEEARPRRIAIA